MGVVSSCSGKSHATKPFDESSMENHPRPKSPPKINRVSSLEPAQERKEAMHSMRRDTESSHSSSSIQSRRSGNLQMCDSSGDESLKSGLRRSHAGSQNLLTVTQVFQPPSGPAERQFSEPVGGCRSLPASPRIRRPPTRESNHVDRQQTEDTVCLNQYRLSEQIGKGSYGVVRLCYSEFNNTSYAMKIMSKKRIIRKAGLVRPCDRGKKDALENLRREIAILKKVDHPNIVKLFEVLDDPADDNLYLVFELVEKGPVMEVPTDNPLPESDARKYFRDIHSGIEYLHFHKIVHRDIKPSNLLLGDDDHIKIADFGVADIFDGEDALLSKSAGSPAFMAPESLQATKDKYSGISSDIWAMGITLYCFIFGKIPFIHENRFSLYELIKTSVLKFPEEKTFSPSLEDLLLRMLIKDPMERISMAAMKEHSWLTKGGSEPLPSTYDNCAVLEPTEEEINNSIRYVPKIKTLILVKRMLKRRHFGNREKPVNPHRFSTGSFS